MRKQKWLRYVIALIILILIIFYLIRIQHSSPEGLVIGKRWHKIKQLNQGLLVLNDSIPEAIPIQYKKVDSFVVFQGDILLGVEQDMRTLVKRNEANFQIESLAILQPHLKWEDGIVYYE